MVTSHHQVINSFAPEVLLIFVKGSGTLDKPLTRIPNPQEWDHGDGTAGLNNKISVFLEQTFPRADMAIRQCFYYGPDCYETQSVTLACLCESKEFINEMNTFISTFHLEIVNTGGG
jgi:hypothetical protein